MSTAKLVALLLVSFIATGAVVYQIRNRRRPATPVTAPVSGSVNIPASDGNAAPAPPPVAVPQPEPGAARARIPANGWGRNPFATEDEIARANQPQDVAVVEVPVQRPIEPRGLPSYTVAGIISGGEQGYWAIVDNRVIHPGDRLGTETVKDIKERGIVLELEGKTREVLLKRLEDTQAVAPTKETKK